MKKTNENFNLSDNGLRVLSLCGGMETGLLALMQLGIPIKEYHTYEILPEAISVSSYHFPFVIHHGDMIGADFTQFKGFDLVLAGTCCFAADELVLTSNGYKKIENVCVGDYVVTHKNRFQKVVNKFNNGIKNTVSVYTMQSSKIECTEDHRFLIRKKQHIYNKNIGKTIRVFSDPEWCEARNLQRDYYVGTPVNMIEALPKYNGANIQVNQSTIKIVDELKHKLNKSEFWKFVGRFIGDGWVTEYQTRRESGRIRDVKKVVICCGHSEKDELEQIISAAGFTYYLYKHQTTYEFNISNYELALFLRQFGKGASNKHLTSDVLNLPIDLLKSFLDGYLGADGCYIAGKDIYQFTTTSKQLAYDISSCWNKVYKIHTSVTYSKRPKSYIIDGRIVNQKNNYIVRCPLTNKQQDKAFYEDGYIWSPFRRIEYTNKRQHVYDIEVENDHSYIVNNVIVHNCQSLSRVRIEDKSVNSGFDGKSGIFFEGVRALEEIKPKWFMFENVIPSNDEDLQTMNEMLGVDGILINSNLFGCQDRERYYWTNIPIAPLPDSNTLVFKDIMCENVDEKYFYKKEFEIIDESKKVCASLKVNSMEMNKRIYNPDFKIATLTCINGGYHEKKVLDHGKPRKLTELEYERCQGLPDSFTDVIVNGKRLSYSKRCSLCGNGWTLPVVKHILSGITN